ncbi:ABC-three component system protein [Paenibacillus prosopidis]|uniref:Alpha/beta hydrolase family protein DUF915 n=1 Tax=Paenibacillus prosopidis TaxID=630520 RepID=A0A368W8J3_9BACL|nr:ABC-three component system protein [Paenibacillus prosopidis]RCW52061.1 alpha/beta hydrolase family protein DUF915 [Paenibacillus prosopidis]
MKLNVFKPESETQNEILVVLIHGLSAPNTFVEQGRDWKSQLLIDPNLKKRADIGVVNYDTRKLNGIFSELKPIDEIAQELKSELELSEYNCYKRIIIVGHSMGGLVGIRYLTNEASRQKIHKVVQYVSLCTPFNGSDMAKLNDLISLINKNEHIKSLKPNSTFIKQMIREWIGLRSQMQNIKFSFCYGTHDRVVDKDSAIPYVESDLWEGHGLDGGHTTILNLGDPLPRSYRFVRDRIIEVIEQEDPPHNTGSPSHGSGDTLQSGGSHSQGNENHNGQVSYGKGNLSNTVGSSIGNGRFSNKLSALQPKIAMFNQRFPSLQPFLSQLSQDAYQKLITISDEEFEAFLKSYQFSYFEQPLTEDGIRQLWELLSLLQSSYPDWVFDTSIATSNIKLEHKQWRKVIFSLDQNTPFEIVLELARRHKSSSVGRFMDRGAISVFPEPLIIENARDIPNLRLCKHCRKKNAPSFGLILQEFTTSESKGVMTGIEENNYSFLEEVEVCCTNCIQEKAYVASNPRELEESIREVV